ncbi:zinc transporter 3-like [Solanum dulcamara]|uniref:zinc transporter 3-like n=1 Tax=Solanum dulcamara TaxID=45834 RepID=UPI0024850DDD|nr:zinc transporter 3-like [Solanum dulcamara]
MSPQLFLVLKIITLIYFSILVQPTLIFANCTCEPQDNKYNHQTKHRALSYKLVAICSILCASALGVIIPILLKTFKSLQKNDYSSLQFLIKAFTAGVILATGFIHILPDAFESLTSPCLSEKLWGSFPFAGFVAMMSAIFTLMMESFATGFHRRAELRKAQPVNIEENDSRHGQGHDEHIAHGPQILLQRSNSSTLMRHRLISQVLELGILVHSVIIGISLGTTENPKTIKPLIIALSFHQFFEGMGLGGCISQAKYKARTIIIMVFFFTVTTPSGIAIGMMISKGYNEQSSTALIVQGVLNSASAGILIYMALVDLLATDFMDPKLHSSFKLQIIANVSLVLGACCMSLLAKWGGA